MSNTPISTVLNHNISSGRMSEFDLSDIRKAFYDDGVISIAEADLMFQVNDAVKQYPKEWPEVFIGAITDFLLRQTHPLDIVDAANAAWLTQRISHDGIVETETEMALLLNILKHAQSIPERLEVFVLDQVKMAVVKGLGALALRPEHADNVIDAQEVELVRHALYAYGGQGGVSVTRQEAEFMFELNDATRGAPNHESWTDLFVGVVACHLMGNLGTNKASHAQAIARKNWLLEKKSIRWNLMESLKIWRQQLTDGPADAWYDEDKVAQAEKVTDYEADWLIERLNRDGGVDENERALLEFLKVESPDVHASLTAFMSRAA